MDFHYKLLKESIKIQMMSSTIVETKIHLIIKLLCTAETSQTLSI